MIADQNQIRSTNLLFWAFRKNKVSSFGLEGKCGLQLREMKEPGCGNQISATSRCPYTARSELIVQKVCLAVNVHGSVNRQAG
jgi:hypothetical protein